VITTLSGPVGLAAGEDARLGQVGGHDRGARKQVADQRFAGGRVEQHGTGLGDHDRVQHDGRVLVEEVERADDGRDGLDSAQHPDLHRIDADVVDDGRHLGDDHLRRDRLDRAHLDGVLRGDGGDGGHAMHPAAREGLEVGLDAGAAAGIRAGDGEHAGNAGAVGHRV